MDLTSLCTREVVGINAQASLREAAALMCDEHVGALVVVTGEAVMSMEEGGVRRLPVRTRIMYPAYGSAAMQ